MQAEAKWYPTAGLTHEQIMDIAANAKHARAIDPTVRSYWRNGFNSLLPHHSSFRSKLHEFVSEGEAAKKSPAALKTWKNEVAAELWNPTEEGEAPPDWKPLYERREDYATDTKITVPRKALMLTVSVDVHKNRLEVLWWAWGRRQENWGILHTVIPGEVQDQAVWKDLAVELARKFDHETGATIELKFGLVDAGKWPEWVMFFLRYLRDSKSTVRGKIRACRGSSHYPYPIINRSYTSLVSTTKTQVSGHWIGTDSAKDLLYTRMALPESEGAEPPPEGWIHYPQSFGQTFFEQLTSERVAISFNKQNEEQRRYVKPQNVRNETLDLSVYNLAAYWLRTTYNWDALEAELLAQVPVDGKAEEKKPPPKPRVESSDWMGREGRGFRV
jgi:phage terminase large subunit GpA-like protein